MLSEAVLDRKITGEPEKLAPPHQVKSADDHTGCDPRLVQRRVDTALGIDLAPR